MSFAKLTTKEIEDKIDQLNERTNTLAVFIQGFKDKSAQSVLETQLNNYLTALDHLRLELEIRNNSNSRPTSGDK